MRSYEEVGFLDTKVLVELISQEKSMSRDWQIPIGCG